MASPALKLKPFPGAYGRKLALAFSARFAPTFAADTREISLSWVDRESGRIEVARTAGSFQLSHTETLPFSSNGPTAMASGGPATLLAWVDPGEHDVLIARSVGGTSFEHMPDTGARSASPPALAFFGNRFWLLWRDLADQRLRIMTSPDGGAWRLMDDPGAETGSRPWLLVCQDVLLAAWRDATGAIRQQPIPSPGRRPSVLFPHAPPDFALASGARGMYLAFLDRDSGLLRLLRRDPRAPDWQQLAALTERCEGAPTITSFSGHRALAWVRADAARQVHVAVEQPQTSTPNTFVFSGDLQGHPTALNPLHHTPFPYLGIIVIANDMTLPRGHTEATLTSGLAGCLAKVKDFWAEASYGKVDISSDVHPQVVTLPGPTSKYLLRARPKILDGFGVTFPLTFAGGETLVVHGDGGYSAAVTFPPGPESVAQIKDFVNSVIDATPFPGDPNLKPRAYWSDIGQFRIQTADVVDPGATLSVSGSAVEMLGLGPNDITVYEGSKVQDQHLNLLLTDAVRAVANLQPDPSAYLNHYYGVVVSLATHLAWYSIRAEASFGAGEVPIFENQKSSKIAYYFITTPETAETCAHETGHNLSLPDLYQEGWRIEGAEVGDWDLMDGGVWSHPVAWGKAYQSNVAEPTARWMHPDTIATLDTSAESIEVLLLPNESPFPELNPFARSHPGVPVCHALRIPLDANRAFYVENRQRGPYSGNVLQPANHSQHLPGDGVVVTDAIDDVGLAHLPRASVVLAPPLDLHLAHIPQNVLDDVANAATKDDKLFILSPYVPSEIPPHVAGLMADARSRKDIGIILDDHRTRQVQSIYPVDTVGEEMRLYQLPDGGGDIRVKLLEVIGDSTPRAYLVRATRGRQGEWFDLEIRKWVNPPPYESWDIWIDSEENGWDQYEHHDAAANPDIAGNPIQNGDRPWVAHENRVYAGVWNHGDIAQNNVRVDFEVMSPPGSSAGYPLAPDFVNLPAGGWALAQTRWTPLGLPADAHACVIARVEYKPWNLQTHVTGETNANNNSAQENLTDFYVERGSPYSPESVPFEFANPLPCRAEMKLHATGLKPGWTLAVEPYTFTLEPGERIEGFATLAAADSVPLEDSENAGPPPLVSLEVMVRTRCTWERAGGFSMLAHAVRKAELHLSADPAGPGIYLRAIASAAGQPVPGANVAARLIAPGGRTLHVTRATTNAAGSATLLLTTEWDRFPADTVYRIEGRLTPSKRQGPAQSIIEVRR